MTDREKTIGTLAQIGIALDMDGYHEDAREIRNAIRMLKEQEAKFVKIDGQLGGIKYGRCPNCGNGLNEEVYPHWCGFCGQAVRWNETLKSELDTLEPLVRLFDD